MANDKTGRYLGPNNTFNGKVPYSDKVEIEFAPGSSGNSVSGTSIGPDIIGTPSLFNPYAMVVFPSSELSVTYDRGGVNNFVDGGSTEGIIGYGGNLFSPPAWRAEGAVATPTITKLVEDTKLAKKTPYYYTDFLYCKYVGKIPLNQLITLRRYPAPTFDNLAVPSRDLSKYNKGSVSGADTATNGAGLTSIGGRSIEQMAEFFPIAQAVTWFGEETGNKLSELMSFTVNMNWKNVEAEVNTVSGNEQGSEDSPAPKVAGFLGILTGQVNTPFATQNSQYDPYNNGPYSHRVYGPVNVISKTYKRDRGLDFKQSMSLNFHYSLKSIGNINPKAAMLDLMSNLLALTYNNAAFWGGANRYFPQKPTYPFLGGKEGMNAWYRGDPVGFGKAVGAQISAGMTELSKILDQLAADPISALKSIAAGAAKLGMIEMGKGKAPSIVAMKALLTGEPIGEWHMVVGNPYAPIAMIGNLICTEAKFQFNDVIGADNFPTELTVTITVEHGRPRDSGDIESMFNQGQGRIYYPPKDDFDVLNRSSATQNSRNDTSWSTTPNRFARTTASVGIFTGSTNEFDSIIGSIKTSANDVSGTGKQAWSLADQMFLRYGGSNPKPR